MKRLSQFELFAAILVGLVLVVLLVCAAIGELKGGQTTGHARYSIETIKGHEYIITENGITHSASCPKER